MGLANLRGCTEPGCWVASSMRPLNSSSAPSASSSEEPSSSPETSASPSMKAAACLHIHLEALVVQTVLGKCFSLAVCTSAPLADRTSVALPNICRCVFPHVSLWCMHMLSIVMIHVDMDMMAYCRALILWSASLMMPCFAG